MIDNWTIFFFYKKPNDRRLPIYLLKKDAILTDSLTKKKSTSLSTKYWGERGLFLRTAWQSSIRILLRFSDARQNKIV